MIPTSTTGNRSFLEAIIKAVVFKSSRALIRAPFAMSTYSAHEVVFLLSTHSFWKQHNSSSCEEFVLNAWLQPTCAIGVQPYKAAIIKAVCWPCSRASILVPRAMRTWKQKMQCFPMIVRNFNIVLHRYRNHIHNDFI